MCTWILGHWGKSMLFRTHRPQLQYDQRKSEESCWPGSHTIQLSAARQLDLTGSGPQQTKQSCRCALASRAGLCLPLNMTHQGGKLCKTQLTPFPQVLESCFAYWQQTASASKWVKFRGRIWILLSTQKTATGEKLLWVWVCCLGFIWIYLFKSSYEVRPDEVLV